MPRAGNRRREGGFWTDHRREGIGIVNIPVSTVRIAVSAVDTVAALMTASTIIGSFTDGIATGAVNTTVTLMGGV